MKPLNTYLSILIVLGFAVVAPAQDFSKDYSPIVSSGQLPSIFVQTYAEKTKTELGKLHDKNYTTLAKKKDFAMSSNYNVDRIIHGGGVLFNDSISAYVNKVLDEILKNDPELRKSIQLYVIKSPQVNAYSFDNGVILVNTGLLSQLDDESQLAFILCHELIHFKRRHSINAYLDFVNVSSTSYHKSRSDLMLDVMNYSKDQESEADTAGLELYKSTGYDFDAVQSAFDVLQYSYLPFDEQEFPRSFFEDGNLKFPKDYFLEKTAPIKANDNYDDSKSSHPNIRKRKTNLNSRLDNTFINTGRKKFIVSEPAFKVAKTISRFETCRLYLLDLDYPNAIYSAFILLKKYPDNLFLRKIVAKSLYEVAAYKGNLSSSSTKVNIFGTDSKYELKSSDDIEGFSQQVYYLLQKLSAEESAALALNYSWKLNAAQNYANKPISSMCDSLFVLLTQSSEKSPADYSKKSRAEILHEDSIKKMPAPVVAVSEVPSDTLKHETSKYEKIKAQQKKEEVIEIATNTEENFAKYAFVEMLKDKKFVERFQFYNDYKVAASPKTHYSSDYAKRKTERLHDIKFGKALGIDKIVLVEPFYYHLDQNKLERLDFAGTAIGRENFQGIIRENEVATYNDFVNANDWINERLAHGSNVRTLVEGAESKEALIAKYGTSYFMWTGVMSLTRKGLLRPYTVIYVIVYDLATEKPVFTQTREIKMGDSKANLNSHFYDIFNQIHSKPAKQVVPARIASNQ
jgi:Zn-dependent protease with chaperone function